MSDQKISLLEKRVIEAQAVTPLIIAFGREMGLEKAKAIVQRINEETSREYGRQCATTMGSNSMTALAQEVASWGEGNVIEKEILEQSERTYSFKVISCDYADRYKALDILEFGYCLSCCRDKPFVEGFNPKMKFKRTQTIMEGAPFCDFQYILEE